MDDGWWMVKNLMSFRRKCDGVIFQVPAKKVFGGQYLDSAW